MAELIFLWVVLFKLQRALKEKLFVLPDYVKVYSGHGQPTEIGFEKKNNMYINV